MNFKEADWLLEKYLSGRCSEEEATRVEQWLDSNESMRNGWTNSDIPARMQRIKQGRERLAASIMHEQEEQARQRSRRAMWMRIAATFLLIALPTALYISIKKGG